MKVVYDTNTQRKCQDIPLIHIAQVSGHKKPKNFRKLQQGLDKTADENVSSSQQCCSWYCNQDVLVRKSQSSDFSIYLWITAIYGFVSGAVIQGGNFSINLKDS